MTRHDRGPGVRPRWPLLFLLILFVYRLPAQAGFQLLDSFSLSAKIFTVDRLQQLYAVDAGGLLTKYTPEGKPQFNFSNRPLGVPSLVDATDPFNLLLYYPEYQTIMLLDRTLAPTAERSLLSLGLIDVQVMAMGNDLHIWLYDQAAFKLYKLDPRGEISLESGDLSLVLAHPPRPTQLLVRNNYIYLYDPGQGMLQFDIFGQYLRTIDLRGAESVQFVGQRITCLEAPDRLYFYDRMSFKSTVYRLPAAVDSFRWHKNRLYGKGEEMIWVWLWRE